MNPNLTFFRVTNAQKERSNSSDERFDTYVNPEIKSLASQRLKLQLVLTVILAAAGLLLTWLILADSSPFHSYFIWHSSLPNLWGMTVIMPYVLAALIAGNPHSPSTVLVILFTIVQWFIVALLVSIPLSQLWLAVRHKGAR